MSIWAQIELGGLLKNRRRRRREVRGGRRWGVDPGGVRGRVQGVYEQNILYEIINKLIKIV